MPADRVYIVTVEGYTSHRFTARSASAARYAAFRAFCEAAWKMPFLDFLRRVHVQALGAADVR